ncbi:MULTISPECIES: SDR family oxidoreductase [Pseudomonadaceae]|uniref:SDR family oxidoreductase n=1 Tax=Stutzerimonas kunmingensis TaxID=1211807 RepID=A0A9X1SR07_9GAMM|nr:MULTISPECIES: SDR family oxidoreductase [Pseudomonadaceae]MBU2282511.1 SDR family oxidoreductase [Gammaproteobacteria bacterium]MCD1610164.1 SDR family oxidoreductase [Stutzerimonas kunmingensis]NKQ13304.1 SDR family oxidoreductase [Pseudomonas sp. SST3]CEG54423.1 Short chain dehydrogenase [Stutzerimonas xanthomarina]
MSEPIAVITGGTAGVGRATAIAFARAGYQLAILARGERGLADTRDELMGMGAKVLAIQCDMADAAAVDRAAEHIEKELGPIDVWVNSAMVTLFGPISTLKAADIGQVTNVTYMGFVHGTLAALRHMRARDRGTIVQVGSALSYRSIPLQAAYCGAKFAIRGFTDSLRSELIHDKSRIRVTMVQLPGHNTPQFDWARNTFGKRPQPVPPIHTPDVAARAILRAAVDKPREFWLGKAAFQAILGNMVLPGVLDRMMAKRAWEGQLTGEDEEPNRPDNLYGPVEGLARTSGRFSERAVDKAMGVSAETVGKIITVTGVTTAVIVGVVIGMIAS